MREKELSCHTGIPTVQMQHYPLFEQVLLIPFHQMPFSILLTKGLDSHNLLKVGEGSIEEVGNRGNFVSGFNIRVSISDIFDTCCNQSCIYAENVPHGNISLK